MELNIDVNSNFEVTEMSNSIINSLRGAYGILQMKESSKHEPDQKYVEQLRNSTARIQDIEGQIIELGGDPANNGEIVELLRPLHRELLTVQDSLTAASA